MTKQNLVRTTDELAPLCSSMCKKLWENPECGGYEKESADYLRGILRDEGFIIVNEEKLKHACRIWKRQACHCHTWRIRRSARPFPKSCRPQRACCKRQSRPGLRA